MRREPDFSRHSATMYRQARFPFFKGGQRPTVSLVDSGCQKRDESAGLMKKTICLPINGTATTVSGLVKKCTSRNNRDLREDCADPLTNFGPPLRNSILPSFLLSKAQEWWRQQSHCWAPFKDQTSNWLGLCDMYNVFYWLLSTSYFRKLVY